jgi:hypothetical protein
MEATAFSNGQRVNHGFEQLSSHRLKRGGSITLIRFDLGSYMSKPMLRTDFGLSSLTPRPLLKGPRLSGKNWCRAAARKSSTTT